MRNCLRLLSTLLGLGIFYAACDSETVRQYPAHFPAIIISNDNPYSIEKASLGEQLFFDKTLSLDSTIACSNCHIPAFAFSDTLALSKGIDAKTGDRNSPSLIYAGFSPLLNKDGGAVKLDIQALIPIEDHAEMGIHILELSKRLQSNASYLKAFDKAFGRVPDAYTIPRALSSYVRSLPAPDADYDRYDQGDSTALSASAIKGLQLFESERLQCGSCHTAPLFTSFAFANNGLYDDYKDIGRALITQKTDDQGKFRIPSLRNVAVTAPYMHDGSVATLAEVIQHYADGTSTHKNKDSRLQGFTISKEETEQLISFLLSLTDSQFNDKYL